jgi:hypothetical protein
MGLKQPIAVFNDDKENLNPFGQQQPVHGLPGSGQQPGEQLLKAPARPSTSSVPKGRTPLADITKLCVGPVRAAEQLQQHPEGQPSCNCHVHTCSYPAT